MNTVWPEPARVGARLTQAPASRPGSKTWLATEDGAEGRLRFRARATDASVLSISFKAPEASVIPSASASAVQSRSGELCRRRVRGGTWRAFAIGPASLAEAPPE